MFAGNIDEVRITNTARYTNDFDVCASLGLTNDASTVALWHFDDSPNQTTATDSSGNGHTTSLQGSPPPTWMTGANCSGSGDMDMLSGSGGALQLWECRQFGDHNSAPTGGSGMTITDTLGRIWGLIH